MSTLQTPFRYDFVGSFLRPQTLKDAKAAFKDGKISQEELDKNHKGLPHGGSVIYTGSTGENKHVIEYSLKLDSNPEFTGSVLAAFARAVVNMNARGEIGCMTVADIAPKDLLNLSKDQILKMI